MDTSSICNVAIPKAKKNNCRTIVQLGDFGFWEHQDRGKKFLDKVSKNLLREEIVLYFLDGNHDNHPLLWERYGNDDICQVRPNLFYVPRGTVWSIHGITCLGLGGAFSIDRDWRLQEEAMAGVTHELFWPTEMITDSDVGRACHNAHGKDIDIMFTHDCPTGVDIPGIHSEGKWVYHETWLNRDKLEVVFDRVQPKMVMHGHYHYRYTDKKALKPRLPSDPIEVNGVSTEGLLDWDYARVDGLACNGMHGFAVVLDLDSLFMSELDTVPPEVVEAARNFPI